MLYQENPQNLKRTPYYIYHKDILCQTLETLLQSLPPDRKYVVHYAVKANDNIEVLKCIASYGLGADCVSGGEIEKALKAGFEAGKIAYAGVGKRDDEIELAVEKQIFCLNAESEQEIDVISEIAGKIGLTAPVAIRINPNIDAHTHKNITTGTEENKFGIPIDEAVRVAQRIINDPHLRFIGVHFHIGSQITQYSPFIELCNTANKLRQEFADRNIKLGMIDMGGGLGIDYENPEKNTIPDFSGYFSTFANHTSKDIELHFELGRSIVAQMGALITRVLFTKTTPHKYFAIVDAGFTDLIRPALYGAYHKIVNLSSEERTLGKCDIVGPICESSDVFAKDREIPLPQRGDILAIRSAGAYGEVMASTYNARPLIKGYME